MAGVLSRQSLTVKLPLLIAGLLVAVMTVFALLAYRAAARGALDAATARLENVAAQVGGLLSRDIEPGIRRVRAVAADPAVVRFASGASGTAAPARAVLMRLAGGIDSSSAVEVRDASGGLLLAADSSTALDSAVASAAPRRPDSVAIGPLFQHDGLIYYELTIPILQGSRSGPLLVIRQRLGSAGLQRLASVIGTDAGLLLGNRNDGVWLDLASPAAGLAQPVVQDGVYERAGAVRLGARTALPSTPWMLAAEFPRAAVLSDARSLARDLGLIALLTLTVGTGLGWLASRRLTRPLSELSAEAETVAREAGPLAADSTGDEVGRLAGSFRTMVGRVRQTQERMVASEAQYRLLFDLNPNPMWVFDRSTLAFLAVNEAAVEKYGYSRDEFLRMTIEDIRPPEDIPMLHEALAAGPLRSPTPGVWRHLTRAGKPLEVEVTGRPLKFGPVDAELVLAQDVTQRRALEAQLRQSQKMEAIGRLAGGVAHDFNNILTVIHAASEFLIADLDAGDPRHNDAREIRAAAERATSLTRQLLAFSRQQVLELRVLDLNEIVGPLEPLLRRLVEANISVVTRLAPDLGPVEADPSQIDQVILNLVVNARDAMPGGGTILIETSNVVLDETYPRANLLARPGRHVVLSVTDSGSGMDAETQAQIFEPFFTTKTIGQGTGLGLATVYGIVKQLGGHIWVYSEVGRGTTFKVYFHEYAGPDEEAAAPGLQEQRGRPSGATILLVEDDLPVRRAITRGLERHQFRVIEAESADAALALLSDSGAPVDLVISDMVMPGMSGIELRGRVQNLDDSLPVLMMSGYSEEAITRLGNREVLGPLIEKPFTVERLVEKIDEVLALPRDPER